VNAAESKTGDEREVEVLRWRLNELLRAGYACDDAIVLTSHREVDLHLATGLVRQGCPPATALRILL
jgi:hypothetical protein